MAEVIPVLPPYKLASREAHPEPSVVDVAGVKIGGGHLGMIAGPCAVESAERMDAIAARGARRPAPTSSAAARSSRAPAPTPIKGMGEEGLKILRDAGDKHGMPVVTEVMDPRRVELVERYADMIQIGARNMQNFVLLTEVGQTRKAGAAQARHERHGRRPADERRVHPVAGQPERRALRAGRQELRHRRRATCSTWRPCRPCKGLSHLPIIVDPSHATGRPDLIPACALAGRGGRRRRRAHRSSQLPGRGPVRRPAGPAARAVRRAGRADSRSWRTLLGKTISPRLRKEAAA